MNREQTYRVVGIQMGERFIITERTTHQVARRIADLIRVGSRFSKLVIEPEPEGIRPNEQLTAASGCGSAAEQGGE